MKIGVFGLGYVGLPLAVALAKVFEGTVGFDIHQAKVDQLRKGVDKTGEVGSGVLTATSLEMTSKVEDTRRCTFYIVAVPTPIDTWNRPDLTPVLKACESVGKVLKQGDIVVFESTVYPGVTEEICGPLLARVSGLRQGMDFKLGYSPERINPGDKEHTVEKIIKVVSGEDEATLNTVASVYAAVITAGVHRASCIKVAEAAKVIENTQRDINIALMNELALIMDRMGIRTSEVLAAARTKWNFLPFLPGLVGGHCIGVDPYYLTTKAEELGYHPQVILAGRRINDGMGAFLAQRTVKLLIDAEIAVKGAKVGILGITFKENCPDIRNSRVPDIVAELGQFGIVPVICDPWAESHEVEEEYGLTLDSLAALKDLDALVLAVGHQDFVNKHAEGSLLLCLKPNGVVVDVKSILPEASLPAGLRYWSL